MFNDIKEGNIFACSAVTEQLFGCSSVAYFVCTKGTKNLTTAQKLK